MVPPWKHRFATLQPLQPMYPTSFDLPPTPTRRNGCFHVAQWKQKMTRKDDVAGADRPNYDKSTGGVKDYTTEIGK